LFVGHGWEDILTMAIGRAEDPSRVCGVGSEIGLRDYFSPPQRSNDSLSQEALRKIEQQMQEKGTKAWDLRSNISWNNFNNNNKYKEQLKKNFSQCSSRIWSYPLKLQ